MISSLAQTKLYRPCHNKRQHTKFIPHAQQNIPIEEQGDRSSINRRPGRVEQNPRLPVSANRFGRIVDDMQRELYSLYGQNQDEHLVHQLGDVIHDWQHADGVRLQVDIAETQHGFRIFADVPGIHKEDVKIQLTPDGILSIVGERKPEPSDEHASFKRMERLYGKFMRRLRMPKTAKRDGINAKIEEGILIIDIDKALPEEHGIQDIPIQG